MAKKVAVEPSLSQVSSLLEQQGYEIVTPGSSENVSAIVIDGGDRNSMGIQDITTSAPVIDARSYTANQILERIKQLP